MPESLLPTPSQTVGPFFNIGLPGVHSHVVAPDADDAIRISGVVYDGEGEPVVDALLEIWQANRAGRYDHPDDTREEPPLEEGFRGFGRAETDGDGRYEFVTVKPGPVPASEGGLQAPHIMVTVFARGLLKHLSTRIYFPDESEANGADPVLSSVEPDRRQTLVAAPDGDGGLRFDVRLQGEDETIFFDV
jgi:protocatechuate 3,4-dioxygenase, alpha subunit